MERLNPQQMENKLELKHLAPYLVHELKIANIGLSGKILDIYDIEIENKNDRGILNVLKGVNQIPILRPLTDLTNTIDYNGESFIPLVYLYNTSNENDPNKELNFEFIDSWDAGKILKAHKYGGDYTEFIYFNFSFRKDTHYEKGNHRFGMTLPHSITSAEKICNQYFLHELLFKWHFDVFGLIEKGLAIDINTIEDVQTKI